MEKAGALTLTGDRVWRLPIVGIVIQKSNGFIKL